MVTSVSTAAQRLLKVAILGLPNAGKSTLINTLVNMTVCPVSQRVHTTRINQHAAYLQEDAQIVFVDTPGLVNMKEIKKFSFPRDFVFGPENSVKVADVVAVIHDLSNNLTRNKLDPRIRGLLDKFPEKDSILILNKVDTVKDKQTLLDTVRILSSGIVGGRPIRIWKSHLTRVKEQKKLLQMDNLLERAKARYQAANFQDMDLEIDRRTKEMVMQAFEEEEIKEGLHLRGWPKFHDVFMVSALRNDGINLLRDYFLANAKSNPWMFEEDFVTDVDPRTLTIRMLKGFMLDFLPQEIPYRLDPQIEFWEQTNEGALRVMITLECPNERLLGRVIGSGGVVIQKLNQATEAALTNLLRVSVDVSINVFTKKSKDSK